jgi:hypothetical protein
MLITRHMGTLTVHTWTHPIMGEIVIVTSTAKDAVLVHRGWDAAREWPLSE